MRLYDIEVFECAPYGCLITVRACEARRRKAKELADKGPGPSLTIGVMSDTQRLKSMAECLRCGGLDVYDTPTELISKRVQR